MSTIRVNKIENTSTTTGGISIDNSGDVQMSGKVQISGQQMPSTGPLTSRNKIINGAMAVAQRGTSFTGITALDEEFPADRFRFSVSSGTFDAIQSATAPSGFGNSIKIDCTSTTIPAANDEIYVEQRIEANNLQDLKYGESAAESITLSFYVRSNKTGSYGIWVYSQDGLRQYATTYTISTANTFEYKTITIPGDTAGTINNDNGYGLLVRWYLAAGSGIAGTPAETWEAAGGNRTTNLNLADNTSNEWLLSGVQLEVGTVATPFEHRSFADELARCQRYFFKHAGLNYGSQYAGASSFVKYDFPVEMRQTPTITATFTHQGTLSTNYTTKHQLQQFIINDTSVSTNNFEADAEF